MNAMLDSESDSLDLTRRHFISSLRFPAAMVAVLWIVHLYQIYVGFDPGEYGIVSRRFWSLRGILTAPLVHGRHPGDDWSHIISNTLPFFILTALTMYFYRRVAWRAFWMIYLLTGALVWLVAMRPVSHIGASGVVYGLLSFIFWNGIFRRSLRSIILSIIVMLVYSGMVAGILPDQEGISWESHLLGSVAGIFTSFWYKAELEDEEVHQTHDPFADERNLEKQYFLAGDIFDKTKAQRAAEAAAEEEARRRANEGFQPPFWTQSGTW